MPISHAAVARFPGSRPGPVPLPGPVPVDLALPEAPLLVEWAHGLPLGLPVRLLVGLLAWADHVHRLLWRRSSARRGSELEVMQARLFMAQAHVAAQPVATERSR